MPLPLREEKEKSKKSKKDKTKKDQLSSARCSDWPRLVRVLVILIGPG